MRVLATWELGGGWGHIARFAPLVRGLLRRGHEVVLAVRQPEQTAPRVVGATVQALAAVGGPPRSPVTPPTSFADILYNVGWHAEAELARLATAWLELIDRVAPDALLMDFSPTVLLASQARSLPRVLLSTGFTSPPDLSPMPNLLPLEDPARSAKSDRREQAILDHVNRVLETHGSDRLERVAQLFSRVDLNVLATWPELDHYGARRGVTYAGVWTDTLGERPDWPAGNGPKVFVYSKAFPALGSLLNMLNRSGLPVLAYLSDVNAATRARAAAATFRIVDSPVDLTWAARQSELAVLNAGHGASAIMLMAGTPLLEIPLVQEQFHVARRVAEMGAGQMASPDSAEQIGLGLERLLTDARFTRNAESFRERHSDFDPRRQIERIVERIIALA